MDEIDLTFWSNNGTIENKIVEVGSENGKPTFSSVTFKSSVDHSSNQISFVSNEPDRTGATKKRNADQDPVSLNHLSLLQLVQHLSKVIKKSLEKYMSNGKENFTGRCQGNGSTSLLCKIRMRKQSLKKEGRRSLPFGLEGRA